MDDDGRKLFAPHLVKPIIALALLKPHIKPIIGGIKPAVGGIIGGMNHIQKPGLEIEIITHQAAQPHHPEIVHPEPVHPIVTPAPPVVTLPPPVVTLPPPVVTQPPQRPSKLVSRSVIIIFIIDLTSLSIIMCLVIYTPDSVRKSQRVHLLLGIVWWIVELLLSH